MNNFFTSQLPQEELQRQLLAQRRAQQQRNQAQALAQGPVQGQSQNQGQPRASIDVGAINTSAPASVHGDPLSAMSENAAGAGDSLDDIIRDNSQELQRRRSIPQPFSGPMAQTSPSRRTSMMEFGNEGDAYRNFQFGGNLSGSATDSMAGGFGGLSSGIHMPTHSDAFSQPDLMAVSDPADFPNIPQDMMGNMIAFSNLNVGQMARDAAAMDFLASPSGPGQFPGTVMDPASADFAMDLAPDDALSVPPAAAQPARLNTMPEVDMIKVAPPQQNMALDQAIPGFSPGIPSGLPPSLPQEVSTASSFQSTLPASPNGISPNGATQGSLTNTVTAAPTPASSAATPGEPKEKTIYSKSGFDMLRALWYVATRKQPQVQLGAVDMSCAFVVCDVTLNDCPIIYVSDNFQNLTGYSRHEIVGQNCRFLQAPDGKVEAGTKREFVENSAVFNLKRKIAEGREVQQSLINYRKGGKPFLNLLTMIPIPWDTEEIRYFIGFQIDLVECPDAIAGQEAGGMQVNYTHSDIGQYIWNPPASSQWEPENGQTLGVDDVSTLLQQFKPKGTVSDWHKQSWDKMLLENTDDMVHVLSLKGLFLYLSPSCRKVLEYDTTELMGSSLASICHPSDIVPVTRELKDATTGGSVNIVFRIRRKLSGYTWFESHGSLVIEQGKGRKCIILVGRKRPVFALRRHDLEQNGGIGDSEIWTKLSTSGMFLFVSSNVRSLLDLHPENLEGTSMQDLMRKESRPEFGRTIEKARRGKIVSCKHEVQNKRGQVLQAQTTLYPGDASEGQKPTFLLAQTKLLKASSRALAPATGNARSIASSQTAASDDANTGLGVLGGPPSVGSGVGRASDGGNGIVSPAAGGGLTTGSQDAALASDDNIFDELKTTRCTSWQYELRQMEKVNRLLAEELAQLLSNKKKRKRRKGSGNAVRDCANCHTRNTPEWRRGPSGNRDLCNSCGLRWAKQTGRVSPRNSSRGGNGDTQSKKSNSPVHNSSPLQREVSSEDTTTPPDETHSRSLGGAATIQSNAAAAAANPSADAAAQAGAAALKAGIYSHPPKSQPLLAGGSGLDGGGMEMTSIREEREMSA